MKENLLEFLNLKKWFGIYYDNGTEILTVLCVVIIGIALVVYLKNKIKRKGLIKRIVQYMAVLFSTVTIGLILQFSGVTLSFSVTYMPLFIFSLGVIVILLSFIGDLFLFKCSRLKLVVRMNKYLLMLIWGEVLILVIMNKLDMIELLTAICYTSCLGIISEGVEVNIDEKQKQLNAQCDNSWILPINSEDDLFLSRSRQLDNFCQVMNKIDDEPYAVMLSGEWGSGKSSFINVFRKKKTNAEYVLVEGGFKAKTGEMLDDIGKQISSIFERNGILLKGNDFVRSYFQKVAQMLEGTGNEFVANIIKECFTEDDLDYNERKQKLNKELEMFYYLTGKKIFIIVDNLDRLVPMEREKIFEIIRESVMLKNCVTVFLADYDAFQTELLNKDFMEKYINYCIKLVPLEFADIYFQARSKFVTEEFEQGKDETTCDISRKLRSDLITLINGINKRLESSLETNRKELSKDNLQEHLASTYSKEIEELNDVLTRVRNRIGNPRKVIRFLQDLENALAIIDYSWFSNLEFEKNDYSKGNWEQDLFEISFLKCFLAEEYDSLINSGNFKVFASQKEYYITSIILTDLKNFDHNIEEELLGLLVYRLYALDLRSDKNEHQIILEEIENNQLNENHIFNYIQEGLRFGINFDYYKIVLDYLKSHNFHNPRNKVEGMIALLENVIGEPFIRNPEFVMVHERLNDIMGDLYMEKVITDKDKLTIDHHLNNLQTQAIWGTSSNFKNVLQLIYEDINIYFPSDIDKVETLYNAVLNLLEKYPLNVNKINDSKISTIINFILSVKNTFQEDKYQCISTVVNEVLEGELVALKILRVWEKREDIDTAAVSYFGLSSMTVRNNVWDNFQTWESALNGLYGLLDRKEQSITTLVSQFMFETEQKVMEEDSIFKNNELVVGKKLDELYSFIVEKYPEVENWQGLTWRWNKIRIYRIKELAKNRQVQEAD